MREDNKKDILELIYKLLESADSEEDLLKIFRFAQIVIIHGNEHNKETINIKLDAAREQYPDNTNKSETEAIKDELAFYIGRTTDIKALKNMLAFVRKRYQIAQSVK